MELITPYCFFMNLALLKTLEVEPSYICFLDSFFVGIFFFWVSSFISFSR